MADKDLVIEPNSAYSDKEMAERKRIFLANVLSDLNSIWTPHSGQIPIGKALFVDGKKDVVAECGRKFGKTDVVCYVMHRVSMITPGVFSYYFTPQQNQIKEIVWDNNRLPGFLPIHLQRKYIDSINNTEKKIFFKNGSYLACDGSDNYDKARGYSCTGIAVYDETKDFHTQFYDAFDPNRAITDAPMLAIGTPGDGTDLLTRLADSAMQMADGAYFNFPSSVNPHISAKFLEKKKMEYIARDEYDLYEREYLAKRVKLGSKHIFPMLSKKYVVKYESMIECFRQNRKDWDFFMVADPGSSKCFAVLFMAVHRYDKRIFLVDELYVTKLGENASSKMIPKIIDKCKEINSNFPDWLGTYDYAAAWFYSDIVANYPDFPIDLVGCDKDLKNKENKLSLIKDTILGGFFWLSDRCVKMYWEMDNYRTDDNGKIPKENDHLLDALRYGLNLAGYYMVPDTKPPSDPVKFERFRITPEADMDFDKKVENAYGDIDNYLFGS
jgi:hypothetical protein